MNDNVKFAGHPQGTSVQQSRRDAIDAPVASTGNGPHRLIGSKESATAIALKDALLKKIRDRHAKVGIIGLGYVGLPLARSFSDKGFAVLGFDIDAQKVAKLQRGESYIGHISAEVVADMR